MGKRWPYALFVLVDLDHKTIDAILGASTSYAYAFWVATENYDDAPKKQPQSRYVNEGTKPPISKDFKSPWVGQKLDGLVQWLKDKPEDTDLNAHHFAVLDKGARDDPPTIVICRIGDLHLEGDMLFLLRKDRVRAVEHLAGAPGDAWDEFVRYHGNAKIDYDDADA